MQTKFGIDVKRDGGNKIKPVEYSAANVTIEINTVGTTDVCELGEHCRCKSYDVAYQQDCWNWVGVVR